VVCKPGYNLIANQLINSNSTVVALFPNVPGGTTILKWNGTTFAPNQFDADFLEWSDPTQTLKPGESAFFFNPATTNLTVTFVGDVPQGNLTNHVPQVYSLKSSIVPQAGTLESLGYVPFPNDTILRYNNTGVIATSNYKPYNYDPDFLEWSEVPSVNVGEGFFVLRSGAANDWVRQFSVN